MPQRVLNRAKFLLERMIVRGALYRLLFIALIMGVLSVTAGLVVYGMAEGFANPPEAIWWAFLRLTDPGYLGDDEGILVRTISTILTVLGFVLFVGALIAILTQWLNETMRDLEHGYTPVALKNHIVILGWTNRTAAIVAELLSSEGRVRRLLGHRGTRNLRVAILSEEPPGGVIRDLKDRLGRLWREHQIILRAGTPLRLEHLKRVDFANAAAILLPAREFGEHRIGADTQIVKTLLSLRNNPAPNGGPLPLVVAEIFDSDKIATARHAYGGKIEILASDSIISRLMAQNVRHRGLSHVYGELLTHSRGNEVYIREIPHLQGARFHDLPPLFPTAVPLGITRDHGLSYRTILNPPADLTLAAGDKLVVLARSYEESEPSSASPSERIERGLPRADSDEDAPEKSILILGWSHRIPALIREFDSYAGEHFRIDILSVVPIDEREKKISRHDASPDRVTLGHFEGDFAAPNDLRRAEPWSYDNIVLLGSDWLESGEEADARTILAYLLLREILPPEGGPEILIELLDPQNLSLFRRRSGEVLISPLILSHMLAQVALRPELRAVFEELFGPGGAEVDFIPVRAFGAAGAEFSFSDIQRRAAARGEIALGLRHSAGGQGKRSIRLNPPKHQRWMVGDMDEVVVLTTY